MIEMSKEEIENKAVEYIKNVKAETIEEAIKIVEKDIKKLERNNLIYSTFMRILNIAVIVFCYLNYKQDHNFVILGSFAGIIFSLEYILIVEWYRTKNEEITLKKFFNFAYSPTVFVLPYYAFVIFYYFTRNKLAIDIFSYAGFACFLILFAIGFYRMVTQLYNRFSKKEVTK